MNHPTHMPSEGLIARVDAYAKALGSAESVVATNIEDLLVIRHTAPTQLEAMLYSPSLCLILQGRKETHLAKRHVSLAAGQSAVVSHHIPIMARIVEASSDRPYLALVLNLDLALVRSLYEEAGEAEIERERAHAFDVDSSDSPLINAMTRLFSLVDRPLEAKVLAPLILREIHFRLLLARHGGMLRQLLRRGSHADRIAKAIAQIRQSYRQTIAVAELAGLVGMSPSSFHQHFKSVTATTPLQYQKNIRLLAARQLLIDGTHSVAETAFEVGYESPTQFSREYSRKFGTTPSSERRPPSAERARRILA